MVRLSCDIPGQLDCHGLRGLLPALAGVVGDDLNPLQGNHAFAHHLVQDGDDPLDLHLIELLPPVGWADVSTRRDLDHLEAKLEAKNGPPSWPR